DIEWALDLIGENTQWTAARVHQQHEASRHAMDILGELGQVNERYRLRAVDEHSDHTIGACRHAAEAHLLNALDVARRNREPQRPLARHDDLEVMFGPGLLVATAAPGQALGALSEDHVLGGAVTLAREQTQDLLD